MRIPTFAVALLAVGAALAAGCGGTAAAAPLDGRTFLSTSVTQGGADRPLVPGTQLRLSFTDGRIGVSAGCNTIGGTYRVDAGSLVVNAAGMTEMGCDPARHAQDDWLATFLSSRPALNVADSELTLERDGTVIKLVDRKIVEADLGLVGPTWTVVSVVSGGAVSSVPDGVVASIQFTADGQVRVRTGCNEGTARVVVDGRTLHFSDLALTKRACPPAATEMETAVVSVLHAGEVSYRIDSRTLDLSAGARGLQLQG